MHPALGDGAVLLCVRIWRDCLRVWTCTATYHRAWPDMTAVMCVNFFLTSRYCDYLHGTVAVTAPQFLNVQPQSGAPASPSNGGLPELSAKPGKHTSKKSSAKAKAASKAAPQAFDSGHLKYMVQEVSFVLWFFGFCKCFSWCHVLRTCAWQQLACGLKSLWSSSVCLQLKA